MNLKASSTSHKILLFVIALIFILDGGWQILKGATSLTRRFRDEMRQNEPAASVAWLQIGLGVIMIVAGSILLYSAFAGAY
ncbi:hypothetical protein [Ligilactobacillus pobuzihii]|uniref:Uncharacterized protein n=1 Tax=Ligilactobacillus pobuzihii TaxID=449659 RepID=A0A0R2LB37_9LACO|nr:hypothetical protein [Ligilactobacillus pobuzihii]KRK11111.1 hypothetical protein FD11_GL000802 [Ligilactobacillus pobuzihii E100301 = KCTC 13174]KRN95943.1 hypothetical protein IV66_GL000971 [Ligilactobacillus pobuzihii]GEN47684.1 hypothetical protein LPO01_04760 [Ligilactobacillus pobuzihii]